MKEHRLSVTLLLVLLLALIQMLREGLEYLMRLWTVPTAFSGKMMTMVAMIVLGAVFVVYAKWRKVPLSVFPERFGRGYIILTCVAAVLLFTAPSNFTEGIPAILTMIYGSIVTPIFEEIIFRGYVWNRIASVYRREAAPFIVSVILFMLWHIGYMIPNIIDGNYAAVLWKLAAGLGYGLVLGFVRQKTKNCYSSIVVHGLLNLFMI